MTKLKYLIVALFLCSAATICTAQTAQTDYFLHTVVRGQSLYSIASMYNVGIDDITRLNPGSEKQIRTGETLRIPQQSKATDGTVRTLHFHTIAPGETLYRITLKYNTDAATICRANPGLSAENFRSGQVIVIPLTGKSTSSSSTTEGQVSAVETPKETNASPCREMHKVKRKETIFSISRQYGITEQELIAANPELKKEKLKRGKFLCIPHKQKGVKEVPTTPVTPQKAPTNEELFNAQRKESQTLKGINAALMLPFQLDSQGGEQTLMVEYYEGLLLAVDSLKGQGVDINLHVYDTGGKDKSIANLLEKPELKKMDIIFGPGHSEHIKPLSDFAKQHDIRLVIPFTSKDSEVFNNPKIYQINTPQSYLFSQVYKIFADNFATYNIVFIEANDEKEKTDYIKGMKQELDTRHIAYHTIAMPTVVEDEEKNVSVPDLTNVLDSTRHNILIPTSSSNVALIKLLPTLQLVVRAENNPYEIHLFGYPDWQKYYNDHLQAFYELDTYFYSSFYTNNLLEGAKAYHRKFRSWYNKEMANTFPKYGMLGFDTGYFFLKGLHRYGTAFEEKLGQIDIVPVQTGFHFERVNNWGGFINKKVFFIHMTRNHELIKSDFAQ